MQYAFLGGEPDRFTKIAMAAAAVLISLTLMVSTSASSAVASSASFWTITPSSNTSATQDNALDGVSCTSPAACVTVGSFSNGTNSQTLIETWDGTAWTITPSPNTSATQDNSLDGVSCISPATCVAVGSFSNGTNSQTLIETWDGTAWTITPSPNTSATQDNSLHGVSCTSPATCVAVGSFSNGTNSQTLIETWDGTAWTITPSPNTSATQDNSLHGVSCTSPATCVAVGRSFYDPLNPQTLIETWDGTAWTITPSPNTPGTQDNSLYGVSCTSPVGCVAVGSVSGVNVHVQTLVETWDGSAWTITSSPNDDSTGLNNELLSVSCTSSTTCVAVGEVNNFVGAPAPFYVGWLVETWDGTAWAVRSIASPFPANALGGVSCSSPTDCMAVGSSSFLDTYSRTLTLSARPGGYRLVASDGGVFNYGGNGFYGSAGSIHLNEPIVGMAATPDGLGYWLVASDGGIFSYGDAGFFGSAGSIHLNEPIVGMAATPDGLGYWLVASDGGIFSYGDAGFFGSAGSIHLNEPIVGMAATPDGLGYWLVASDGGIFSYGDAGFFGSAGSIHLNEPIVGMAATPDGLGYWLVASDGGIFSYGDAGFFGSAGSIHLNEPIVGMAATPDGLGYWLVASDGGIFNYGDAGFFGSAGSIHLNKPIVGMAG